MRPRRGGLSLVEVVVALVVLSVGLLGAAGVALRATAAMREARAFEAALLAGTSVLDSLRQQVEVESGARRIDRFAVRWTAGREGAASRIDLVVSYDDGTRRRSLALSTLHLTPPPALGGGR